MKYLKLMLCTMMVALATGCKMPESNIVDFPEIVSLENTLWYSYNKYNDLYFDIKYEKESGWMKCYNDAERTEEVSSDNFTYTFSPASNNMDAQVGVTFDNGDMYAGILVPKGHVYINYEPVYLIQLYKVDDQGNILYNPNGEIESTILMWME